MAHLTPEFFRFFEDLAANNTTDWFKAQKSRYEAVVKGPFEGLVAEVLDKLQAIDPRLQGQEAKKCIFRLNRDIRFSADKSPYKTQAAAVFSHLGKNGGMAGIYFHLGAGGNWVGGGSYMPEPADLKAIREEIAAEPTTWQALIGAKDFTRHFAGIEGEALKRAPKGFEELADTLPILKNKQFYFGADLTEADALAPTFADRLVSYYQAARPVNDFLLRATGKG